MNDELVKVNDVVQCDPAHGCWGPVFLIVTKVRPTHIQGYFMVPEERDKPPGAAYVNVDHGKYVRIGRAVWTIAS